VLLLFTDKQDATDALKRRRTELADTLPTEPVINMEVFAHLISETDASVEKIIPFLEVNGLLDVDTHRRGTHVRELSGGVVLDVFSTSLLPYDWHFASRGIWSFYRGSQKHHGTVFGKTAQVRNSVDGSTVGERCLRMISCVRIPF
jgi:hypothetical protein